MWFFYHESDCSKSRVNFFLRVAFSSLAVVGLCFGGILFFIILMLNILSYGGVGEGGGYFPLLVMGGFVLLASFMPGAAWVALMGEGVKKQVKFSAAVFLSAFFMLIIAVPDIRKVVVFNTGKVVGLHSDSVRQYLLTGSDADIARFRSAWPRGSIDENGMFSGKQLFSMGGAELICPSSLTLNVQEMLNLERGLGADCMLFRSSQVVKGHAILSDDARAPDNK